MSLLLSFAPFLVFAVCAHLGLTEIGLWAAAVCSLVLIAKEQLGGRSLKILEVGTLVLFPGLAVFTTVARFDWTIPLVRLVVDFGLLVIVLVSLAIGRPFTLQYARETTSPEIWNRPEFMAVNRRITLVWAAAFAVLVLADAGMAFLPQIPHGVMILVTVAALLFAFKYTAQSTKAS